MEIRGVNNGTAAEVDRLFPKIYIIFFSPERSSLSACSECLLTAHKAPARRQWGRYQPQNKHYEYLIAVFYKVMVLNTGVYSLMRQSVKRSQS